MSANQVYKSFTAVMVLLVGVLCGNTGWGAEDMKSCMKTCASNIPDYTKSCDKQTSQSAIGCLNGLNQGCKSSCEAEFGSAKERKANCSSAMKEYGTAQTKSKSACKAFDDKSTSTNCSTKVAACESKINGGFSAPADPKGTGMDMLQSLIVNQITSSANPNAAANLGNGACVSRFDAKAVLDAEKELKRDKKELEKDIKKEFDEQIKFGAEQKTKENEIAKKIAELNKDLKKEALKKDAEMRKKIADAAKATIDSAKKLRQINLSITAENNKLAQLRFSYQTALLDLTDEKVTTACKNQLMSLKSGILNSGAVDPKAPEASQLKALADQIKNQGAKGTGNLKVLLAQAQKQCFQNENTKKSQKALDYNQKLAEYNNNIKEFQSQIEDEKKQLALSQDSIKKIQEETDKEKNEEQSAVTIEITNLNKELMDNAQTIKEKLAASKLYEAKLKTDIQNLVLKTNTETKMAFVEAEDAINGASELRSTASESCECSRITAENKTACEKLSRDGEAIGEPTEKPDATGDGGSKAN